MTWGWNSTLVSTIKTMLAGSREACVNYMDPLGLGGIFSSDGHYGPEPDYNGATGHLDWNSVYWHKADNIGVGYNRSTSGSDFVSQYFTENKNKFNSMSTCPNELLCWFFHVPWGQQLNTGRTFWNELCYRYYDGVHYVGVMDSTQWPSLSSYVDAARFNDVKRKLDTNYTDARTWRETCTKYFATFSKLPIPSYNPTGIIQYHPKTVESIPQPMQVYDLQGRLTATLIPNHGHSLIDTKRISAKVVQGIYIVKQEGAKSRKVMVGIH
jgi:alpha-glucuronidase